VIEAILIIVILALLLSGGSEGSTRLTGDPDVPLWDEEDEAP
jgi:hypothetical protein